MKFPSRNPFALLALAAAFSSTVYAQTTLLTDNFNTEADFNADPNADQGGTLAPATYNPVDYFETSRQRRGNGVLELGFDGANSGAAARLFTNADYVNAANTLNSPVRITFDINASQVDWVGLVVGTTSAWLDGNGGTTEFSALFNNSGGGNKWVNGSNLGGLATDTSSLITLVLSNTAGTGSPFNGTGSVAKLMRGTTDLGTYTLEQLTATNGRLALCAYNGNGGAGGTFDNLDITATSTVTLIPRWSGSINGTWDDTTANFSGQTFSGLKSAGATSALFGDNDASFSPVATSNVTIAASGVEIADVVFDNASLQYTLACAGATGIKGTSNLAKSGAGLLTLTGPHSYTGTTIITDGTIALSGGNNLLPVTTALTLTSPGLFRLDGNNQTFASLVSNGRVENGNPTLATLTVNNSANTTFAGTLGGISVDEDNLALVKSGPGTLTLTAPSTFTGGTTIQNGTLSLAYGTPSSSNSAVGPLSSATTVTINSGGILTGTVNNWLAITSVDSGATIAPTVIVNGGTLRGANGFVSGLGNVTLNGGTLDVTNGLGQFGWFASFNLGGDITVSGSAPSAITTASGAGANAVIFLSDGANSSGGTRSLIVGDVTGNSATDLSVSARIALGTLVKKGPGTVEITPGETGTQFPATWEIEAGSFLLAEPATFEFRVTNSTSNRVIEASGGTGSATFNGTLNINTTAVTLTSGNNWPLVDVAGLGAAFGTNFAVSGGFSDPNNDGIWTKTDFIGDWSFSETTGNLILSTGSPYSTWAGGFPGFTPTTGTLDFENDGIQNLLEFVLGGNPTTNDSPSIRPTVSASGSDLVVTFNRTDLSETEPVTVKVQTSPDLVTWTNFATIGATSDIPGGYTVAENGAAADTIVVTIPKGLATKKFTRVSAE